MSPGTALLLFAAGSAAGFVNAVAGGGSAITLPILIEMVGGSVANGTNRVAVLLASLVSTVGFERGGVVPWRLVRALAVPTVLGAGGGAWLASQISAEGMRRVFAIVIIGVALSVALKPSRWVQERDVGLREPFRSLVFFAIGFYGGFVQAGVGFLLLAGLVLGGGLDLVAGNGAKVALIAAYSAVALVIFAGASQVDFRLGSVMAAGNMTGAFTATRLALRDGAIRWIRWVLVVAATLAALRMLLL